MEMRKLFAVVVVAALAAQANAFSWQGIWDSATSTVSDLVSDATCYVDKQVISNFDLNVCDTATVETPCPAACKEELQKLTESCLNKVLEALSGNALNTTEATLTACDIPFSPPNSARLGLGSLLVPFMFTATVCFVLAVLQP